LDVGTRWLRFDFWAELQFRAVWLRCPEQAVLEEEEAAAASRFVVLPLPARKGSWPD
jgi:hypothetical protein